MNYQEFIRDVHNFPKEGILFRDITPLLNEGHVYRSAIDCLAEKARLWHADVIVGPEARGYVVGAPLAYALRLGFVPVRKKGKLPAETVSVSYELEYGTDILQMHADAIKSGQRVVVADDLLATGGTMRATVVLVEKLGGLVVGAAFLIELTPLLGRSRLPGIDIETLVSYK